MLGPDSRVPEDLQSYIRNFGWPRDDERYRYRVTTPEDAPLVNELFNRVFQQDRPVSHYRWKAWGSPAGPPFSAHAVSRETGRAVASMTGVRRRFQVAGRRADAVMICETCSDPDERRGGHVYRKTFKGGAARATDSGQAYWAYGGQSTDQAIAVGARWFGYVHVFTLEPLEVRLSLEPALERRFGGPGRAVGRMLRGTLAALLRPRRRDYVLHEVEGYGAEFDFLWERYRDRYQVVHFRDAAELQWRYADNPRWQHRTLVAWCDGEPCGYVIWREWEPDSGTPVATVMDLWTGGDPELIAALLDGVVRAALERGCAFLRFAAMPDSVEFRVLVHHFGARVQESEQPDRVLVGPTQGSDPETLPEEAFEIFRTVLSPAGWYYTQGDCDLRD